MTKIGIVGLGPIGGLHADNLLQNKIPGAELACVCEQRPVDEKKFAGLRIYNDMDKMLSAGGFDALIIATPSFTHFPLAKKALERGFHALVEKPMALCSEDALELADIAKRSGKVLAVMLNQRTAPLYSKIREMVESGEIGRINRVSWTMSNWYRPDIYFASSSWKGTWKGEAGGVLINQSIHNIDIWAWIFGLPKTLRAWCQFGKYHNIEVEDEVCCRMELSNGASSTFISSTGEYPGSNRLVIAGDKAFVVAESGKLKIFRFVNETLESYTYGTKYIFGSPEVEEEEIEFFGAGEQHAGVVSNFVEAINGDAELLYTPEQGALSLQMANAMLMSAWTNKDVSFPFDHALYKKMLSEKIAFSHLRENPKTDFIIDFEKSFK